MTAPRTPEIPTATVIRPLREFFSWSALFVLLIASTITVILAEGASWLPWVIGTGTVGGVGLIVFTVFAFARGRAVFGSLGFPIGMPVVLVNALYSDVVPDAVTAVVAFIGITIVAVEFVASVRRERRVRREFLAAVAKSEE